MTSFKVRKCSSYGGIKPYSKTTVYQAETSTYTLPFELTRIKDKLGTLYVFECSHTVRKRIETYNKKEYLDEITKFFQNL